MRDLLVLAFHLLVTAVKLLRPGGVRAVAAESVLLKHQLQVSNRSRQRAPNLTSFDRIVLGLATLFVSIPKIAAILKLATNASAAIDPLFRFQRWLANLRVLEIEQIKSVPWAPVSHPFVERLIGTIRGEYLDRVFFWNVVDRARKRDDFRTYYNAYRVHRSLVGVTPAQRGGASSPVSANLASYAWKPHCRGLFLTPMPA